jgi:cation diffusion facilitator CzcD-associated flavoprotein CzcO
VTARAGDAVAVIGAGPAGLVAARYLASEGFRPVLFDAADRVGGQWRAGDADSSVWPGMRTNTSRVTTAFSDLEHPEGTPTYPTGADIGAYLQRFADASGTLGDARFASRVDDLSPTRDSGWLVTWTASGGRRHTERFDRAIVASGRYRTAHVPAVPGLDTFRGDGGISHVARYRGAAAYAGKRVLVAGHSISAVEIASELALKGAERVVVASRRHRYVLQKLITGVPIEHRIYTRAAGLGARLLPPADASEALRAFIVRTCGHPSQFGAPCHAEDPSEAGFTQNQYYLPLVAEGRIHPRPWLTSIDATGVTLADGSHEEVDAILFGTGYALDLPCAGQEIQAALDLDAAHADLHEFTFHPDLPGLAFIGLFEQGGPYFTPLELQARWIAYSWSGRRPTPTASEMRAGVAAYRARRRESQFQRMHLMCHRFGTLAGVEPRLDDWPGLERALLFGVQSPASFRLEGPEALPNAGARVLRDAAAFGAVVGPSFTTEEMDQLRALVPFLADGPLRDLCLRRA